MSVRRQRIQTVQRVLSELAGACRFDVIRIAAGDDATRGHERDRRSGEVLDRRRRLDPIERGHSVLRSEIGARELLHQHVDSALRSRRWGPIIQPEPTRYRAILLWSHRRAAKKLWG